MTNDKTGGMGKLSQKVVIEVDAELSEREIAVIARAAGNLADLRPQIGDQASFDALVTAVEAANRRNESVAEIRNRIQALGEGVMTVAKKVATLV